MKVNILMSTFNGQEFLADQIRSIQEQTYTDWTLLIRDDGSKDKTRGIIAKFVQEDSRIYSKNQFLKAVRKFMEMKSLMSTMLLELIKRIDVYHIQGTGKNRTQQLVIHYKFIGVLNLPENKTLPDNVTLNSRQGVEIEYLVGKAG